jgi:NADH dehydrogenase FAD-containing subunit
VQGRVTEVDCGRKRCTIQETGARNFIEEHYDYLVAASGLRRTWPSAPRSLSRKAYLAEATKHISQAKHARSGVVVIGGGAVGIEMAAELKLARPEQKVTLIHSRDRLLSSEPLPDSMKDRALSALQSAGVETILRSRVTLISPDDGRSSLTLSGGRRIQTSHVIDAVSRSSPTTSYLPAGAVDSEGYVKVDSR